MLNEAVSEDEWNCLKKDVGEIAEKYPGTNIIGSGGNINKYLKLIDSNSNTLGKNCISVVALKIVYNTLKDMSVEERMQRFNLKTDRADVIVPAGKIFTTVADLLKSTYILVPVIGLADGIIDGIFRISVLKGCLAPGRLKTIAGQRLRHIRINKRIGLIHNILPQLDRRIAVNAQAPGLHAEQTQTHQRFGKIGTVFQRRQRHKIGAVGKLAQFFKIAPLRLITVYKNLKIAIFFL